MNWDKVPQQPRSICATGRSGVRYEIEAPTGKKRKGWMLCSTIPGHAPKEFAVLESAQMAAERMEFLIARLPRSRAHG